MMPKSFKIYNIIKSEISKLKKEGEKPDFDIIQAAVQSEDFKIEAPGMEDEFLQSLLNYAVEMLSVDMCKTVISTGRISQYMLKRGLGLALMCYYTEVSDETITMDYDDKFYSLCEFLLRSGARFREEIIPNCVFSVLRDNFDAGAKLLKFVLDHGANINVLDSEHGYNLLSMAACIPDYSKAVDIIKLLMQYHINPELTGEAYLETPLMLMAERGSIEFCELLLDYGADLTMEDFRGLTVLDFPISKETRDLLIEKIMFKYPKVDEIKLRIEPFENRAFGSDKTSKMIAEFFEKVKDARIDEINKFIKSGVEVNYKDFRGNIALNYATDIDVVRLLIDAGSDLKTRNNRGEAALYAIVKSIGDYDAEEELKIIELLLKKGADLNELTYKGKNLLHKAALYGREKLSTFLLERGIKVNQSDIYGKTPLMRAAQKEALETIEVLLKYGADPMLKCLLGKTALDHAYTAKVRTVLSAAMEDYKKKHPKVEGAPAAASGGGSGGGGAAGSKKKSEGAELSGSSAKRSKGEEAEMTVETAPRAASGGGSSSSGPGGAAAAAAAASSSSSTLFTRTTPSRSRGAATSSDSAAPARGGAEPPPEDTSNKGNGIGCVIS